jgi:hypothetical protein
MGKLQRTVIEWVSTSRGKECKLTQEIVKMHTTKIIQRRLSIEFEGGRMEHVEEIKYLRTVISTSRYLDMVTNYREQKANQFYCQINQTI